jgi:hypothetical protein
MPVLVAEVLDVGEECCGPAEPLALSFDAEHGELGMPSPLEVVGAWFEGEYFVVRERGEAASE